MDVFCRDLKLNISEKYLRPGNPFGGSCLPKDLRALLDASRTTAVPMPMHAGMLESNRQQVDRIVERIVAANGRHPVGLIGLAFKEGTDDVRESPMVALAEQLLGKGIPVRIYDENLTISNMIGANRSFAIEAIPHLVELLSNDLKSVVAASRTLVINHRLTTGKWDKAGLRPDQSLFDLVNVEELASESHYEGLYW
jgi:GDP-mannose 6-dehydrogenase